MANQRKTAVHVVQSSEERSSALYFWYRSTLDMKHNCRQDSKDRSVVAVMKQNKLWSTRTGNCRYEEILVDTH